jgi:hypothetical protein
MTKEEALAYLGEDWEDVFEEEVFALKQQLLTLLPVHKLYQSKIDKWKKLEEAFVSLGGKLEEDVHFETPNFSFSEQLLEAFESYQKHKNNLKLKLTQITTSSSLINICNSLIELELKYALKWNLNVEVDQVVLSSQPDPMEILQAIKLFNNEEGYTFTDLKEKINVAPKVLIEEQKRLTLYYSKYGKQ